MAGVAMSSLRSAFASCGLALLLASATHAVSAAEVTFVLRIQNGRLPENMRRIRVKQNDVVKLQWSTDKAMSLHLHGYDTEMTFTARATGRFAVAPHLAAQPGGGHAHGDVLVTIEVYP